MTRNISNGDHLNLVSRQPALSDERTHLTSEEMNERVRLASESAVKSWIGHSETLMQQPPLPRTHLLSKIIGYVKDLFFVRAQLGKVRKLERKNRGIQERLKELENNAMVIHDFSSLLKKQLAESKSSPEQILAKWDPKRATLLLKEKATSIKILEEKLLARWQCNDLKIKMVKREIARRPLEVSLSTLQPKLASAYEKQAKLSDEKSEFDLLIKGRQSDKPLGSKWKARQTRLVNELNQVQKSIEKDEAKFRSLQMEFEKVVS